MAQKFESNGRMYDVEIFQHEDTDIVRFYEERNEQYGERLSNLVIGIPSYGFYSYNILRAMLFSQAHSTQSIFVRKWLMTLLFFARIISPLAKTFIFHIILIFLQYLLLRNIMENIKEDN